MIGNVAGNPKGNPKMNTNGPYFVRADGYLTRYAHGCGYLDSATANDDRMAVTLGVDGACYHVKARYPYAWETFDIDRRADAVKCFRAFIRERKAVRNTNAGRRRGAKTRRYCVTVEYETLLSVKRAPVNVNATDIEGAENVARNYASEQMGTVKRIISVVALG